MLVSGDADRVGQQTEFNPLFHCVLDFFPARGQLVHRTAIDDIDLFSAQAHGAACSVHSHVSAAHNGHAAHLLDGGWVVRAEGLHQVHARQELVGGIHTLEVFTGDIHKVREPRAGADKHRFIAHLEQLVDGEHLADDHIGFDFNAQCFERVNLLLNNGLGQTEFRNTVDQHAARRVQRLKHRDFVSLACKIARAGQAGRACADDRNFVPVGFGHDGLFGAVRHMPVSGKALQTADGDGFALHAANAFAFALRLLRADTTANSGQGRGLRQNLIGFFKLARFDLLDEGRDINGNRAAADAGLVAAVQAAGRLIHRLLGRITQRHFVEIARADFRLLRGHGILFKAHVWHLGHTSLNRLQVSSY